LGGESNVVEVGGTNTPADGGGVSRGDHPHHDSVAEGVSGGGCQFESELPVDVQGGCGAGFGYAELGVTVRQVGEVGVGRVVDGSVPVGDSSGGDPDPPHVGAVGEEEAVTGRHVAGVCEVEQTGDVDV